MKKLSLLAVVLGIVAIGLVGSCSGNHGQDQGAASAGAGDSSRNAANRPLEYYTCPMHPSVVSDRPGACPVCGMALVKRTRIPDAGKRNMPALQGVQLSPAQRVIANVLTAKAEKSDVSREITAVGVVDVAEPLQARVAARFDGRIEKLYVGFTGATVREGDPLFDLHSPDLISAEQELILAINAVRDTSVWDPNKDDLLDAARQRLHVHFGMTHDQIEVLESNRSVAETMTFRSPISGTVISKSVQPGQYVTEGMELYQLADLSRLWVFLDAYEQDVPYIRPGISVRITTASNANKTFQGKVTFVDPVINPETRTVRVRTEFANPAGELKPQMYVRAQILIPGRMGLRIPSTAVMYTGKRTIVWVEVGENLFEPRVVTLGADDGQSVEVLGGLKEGDQVVSSGGFMIESESQLQIPSEGMSGHSKGPTAGQRSGDTAGHR